MRGSGVVSKRLTKEELKEDRVVVALTQASDYARRNARWVLGAVGLAVVAILVAILISQGRVKAEQNANLAMAQAQSLYFSGDYAQAATQFQAVSERYGSSKAAAAARLLEGNSLLAVGNATGAEQAFRKFLDKGEFDPIPEAAGHRGLAGSLAAQDKFAEGAEEFTKAARVAGNTMAAEDWLQAGITYLRAGRNEDAARSLQRVLDDYAQSQSANEARVRLYEATAAK